MINSRLQISNQYNQDSAAEAEIICKIIQQTTISILLESIDSYKEVQTLY